MNSLEEFYLCHYCLKFYSIDNIRQVKLRALEFIRNYLNSRLIKLNRICLDCIDNYVRDIVQQYNRSIILNTQSMDIDYTSTSMELNLTLQYIDQNQIPSIRITSPFISITTIEQIIHFLIQALDLAATADNLLLTVIKKENNDTWYPIVYDKCTTLYQLNIQTNDYLRFEFNLELKRNSLF